MVATFTLTGDLEALTGSANSRNAFVQLDRAVVDTTNDVIYDLASSTPIQGDFTLAGLPAKDALNNANADFNLVVTIGKRKWLVPAPAAGSTHDLSEFVETTGLVPVDTSLVLAAQAAATAAAASAASVNRGVANGVASLDASTLVPDAQIPATALRVTTGPTEVNVRLYGVRPSNTATQNDTGLASLFAAYPNGVALAFPEVGTYLLNTPLPIRNNMSIRGVSCGAPMSGGGGTLLRVANGLIVGGASATMSSLHMSDIAVDNSGGTKAIFDMAALGLINSTFERVDLYQAAAAQSIFKVRDAVNVFGIRIRDSYLRRVIGSTVPAIDVISNGGGVNGWTVEASVIHSYLCTGTPFARFESTSAGAYINNVVFRDIIGEQNRGGLLHVYGGVMCSVVSTLDWDSSDYTDDIVRFDTSSSSRQSYQCHVDDFGTAGTPTFTAGKNHVKAASGFGHRIGRVISGPTSNPYVDTNGETLYGNGTADRYGARTLSQTLTLTENTLTFNGASLTATLPDAVALRIPAGRGWRLKNLNATALTVAAPAGYTLDGVASKTLAQYASAEYVTDGTNWFVY
jgi:hypothetical protein